MQNHAIKRYSFLFLAFFWLFSFSSEAAAQISGVCPLPPELFIKVNDQKCAFNEIVVVDEDTPVKIEFFVHPFAGTTATKDSVTEISVKTLIDGVGSVDSSTVSNEEDWQPDHANHTNPTYFDHIDPKPAAINYDCWQPAGGHADRGESHQWASPGWKIKEVKFLYTTDDFDIGNNANETGTDPADPKINQYVYNIPSVPDAYNVRANLSMRWEWNSSLNHRWKHSGYSGTTDECHVCNKVVPGRQNAIHEVTNSKSSFVNPPSSVAIDSNGEMYWGHSHIENMSGAVPKARMDFLNYGSGGPPGGLGPVSDGVHPGVVGKVLTARVRIVVKDKGNIAHVQTGYGNDNILKAQTGQKVSATDDNKKLTVRFVDNNPNATKDKITGGSSNMPLASLPAAADCKDENFKMIFWYEWPIYQYSSYKLFEYFDKDPATGADVPPKHNFCNVMYAPMFVWKKGKVWTKLSDFLSDTTGGSVTSVKLYKDGAELTAAPMKDPDYAIYEGTFPLSHLMTSADTSKEDIVAWHYAKTSWGDGFGNPAYDKDKDSSSLYNTVKPDGKDVKDFFKYPPVNYKNGKGPLKYFFEIRDCSNNGGGKGETNFNCAETYFTDFPTEPAKAYVHPQIKFNSDAVKYMVKSSQLPITSLTSADGAQISTIDIPGGTGGYCESDDYAADPIQTKWKDNTLIKNYLNPNADEPDSEILKYYQAWGKIEIEDTIKPNVGIYIKNTVKQNTRRIYMEDGFERLYYSSANLKLDPFTRTSTDSDPNRQWALIDKTDKYNYHYLPSSYTPNPNPPANSAGNFDVPFDDLRDEWVFDQIPKNSSGKLYEGDELNQDTKKEGYGVGKDIQLIVKHQDLREPGVDDYFVPYYAYDNIDGQRLPKPGQEFDNQDWYKGVAADNNSHNQPNNPVFADNKINLGFVTWAIKDENYDQATSDSIYKVGNYYTYPKLTVSSVNCDWDGTPLNGGKEISLSYAVVDKNKNHRKIKLHLFVAPTDMSITTIEKQEKRNE